MDAYVYISIDLIVYKSKRGCLAGTACGRQGNTAGLGGWKKYSTILVDKMD
jgi:hypothetical protein